MTANAPERSKPTLYLENTIVSYLAARPSRDLIVAAHQQITREWWDRRRDAFTIYISPVVLEEASQGDPQAARARLELLDALPVLAATPRVEEVANVYFAELGLPDRVVRDAAHLAFAVVYEVEYLLMWNCAHIANAEIRRRLQALNARLGLHTPTICTPEELLGTHAAE